MNFPIKSSSLAALIVCFAGLTVVRAVNVADYPSIQEAIDKNPGKMIEVPPGDYPISASLNITTDNTGLTGYGRIIQTDPNMAVVTVTKAANVQIRNLTFTRPDGKEDCLNGAINATESPYLLLQDLRILNNRSQPAVINMDMCDNARILNCLVDNYMTLAIDDRTKSKDWGFGFYTIDGTGICLAHSKGGLIQGNSVIEHKWLPTQEMKEKYKFGQFAKKNPVKGQLVKQSQWDSNYFNAWQQGAAIAVPTPESDDYVRVLGNYIENAAQGMDIHADHVIISQNIINNAFIGMKAMHGARNVIITNNQFSRNDLWSICLMPGAGSHPAKEVIKQNVSPDRYTANIDGDSIVANNIISDFGYGSAHWIWPSAKAPLLFERGQKVENPALKDVIVRGNIVYDTGRDKILVDGRPVVEPPRYQYAVFVDVDSTPDAAASASAPPAKVLPAAPHDLHFSDNLLNPGKMGVSNVDLKP